MYHTHTEVNNVGRIEVAATAAHSQIISSSDSILILLSIDNDDEILIIDCLEELLSISRIIQLLEC